MTEEQVVARILADDVAATNAVMLLARRPGFRFTTADEGPLSYVADLAWSCSDRLLRRGESTMLTEADLVVVRDALPAYRSVLLVLAEEQAAKRAARLAEERVAKRPFCCRVVQVGNIWRWPTWAEVLEACGFPTRGRQRVGVEGNAAIDPFVGF